MVIQDWTDILGEDLAVTLALPVGASCRALTSMDAAARLIDAIGVIESIAPGNGRDGPLIPGLERLELKLDLLIHLISSSLEDQVPPPVRATLSATGLVVPEAVLPMATERVAIYPCAWLPRPLVLAVEPIMQRGAARGARWQDMNQRFVDALGRWIFRVHRREVASARTKSAPEPPAIGVE